MGVRTNTVLQVQVGLSNTLDDCIFERSFTELLDTLDHATSQKLTIAASTTNLPIDFGDVTQARLIYIESDTELEISLGGGAATSASVTGSGGTFPTSFAGGETLLLEIDGGGLITCTFESTDQSLQQVANRINACAALNGQVNVAFLSGGELQLTSPTTGTGSEVDIQGGTSAATLGLSVAVTNGVNSNPGTSNLLVQRPVSPTASSAAGVLAYFLATVNTSSLYVTNNSATANANVSILIAGDLVS
jgi:hypothetical protein